MQTPTVRFVASILEIDRGSWCACFGDELEGYDYHAAIEAAGLNGFELGWYIAEAGNLVVCAVPVFFTAYDLSTTAQGAVQRAIRKLQSIAPRSLTLALSCLGSPETERCPIGFHSKIEQLEREDILHHVIVYWLRHGQSRGAGLFGIKDLSDGDQAKWASIIERNGLRPATSMPTAGMPVDFDNIEGYLARLSRATRKDLRRKMRSRQDVRIEVRHDPGTHLNEIMEMYRETRDRSEWAFEDIPHAYFSEVLARMPDHAVLVLYYLEDRLTAANLLLRDSTRLLDKFFVMRASEGRQFNLYFVSWIVNLEMCLDMGLRYYQSGQAAYDTKLRLGCRLSHNWIYFRHRNPILNALLRVASPLLSFKVPAKHGTDASANA